MCLIVVFLVMWLIVGMLIVIWLLFLVEMLSLLMVRLFCVIV